MLFKYSLDAPKQNFYNITAEVRESVVKSGITDGLAVVYCPHTTAGITINENADPDVVRDLLFALDKPTPIDPNFATPRVTQPHISRQAQSAQA
jgi:secondary thiamine-phosphate synthase enzyme